MFCVIFSMFLVELWASLAKKLLACILRYCMMTKSYRCESGWVTRLIQ
jgi:hypothetical protein